MKTNTLLCIDLKTKLQNEVLMKPGKEFPGILRRDVPCEDYGFDDNHYTFLEVLPLTACRRNPRVFDGKFITVTRRSDGTLHPNFKQMQIGGNFTVEGYAFAVCNELRQALKDLVEK